VKTAAGVEGSRYWRSQWWLPFVMASSMHCSGAERLRPEPEIEMIARPTDLTHPNVSSADLPAAETPLQRQILLWQRELLRRREAGLHRPTTLPHSHESTK
jgi:hypothetical protein